MVDNGCIWSSRHEVPSNTAAATGVIEVLLERLREAHWGERDLFGVHLAVEEALVNAIKHGNAERSDKRVLVEYHLESDRIGIRISDEGSGFDPEAVPDPTAADQLELPNGRGIMLMKHYMTKVEYNQAGNSVWMEKRRSAA
jgi:serine/threonine-protein kinase RsbW